MEIPELHVQFRGKCLSFKWSSLKYVYSLEGNFGSVLGLWWIFLLTDGNLNYVCSSGVVVVSPLISVLHSLGVGVSSLSGRKSMNYV